MCVIACPILTLLPMRCNGLRIAKHKKPTENFAIVYNGFIAGSIGCTPKEDVYKKTIEIGYFVGEEFWGKRHSHRSFENNCCNTFHSIFL